MMSDPITIPDCVCPAAGWCETFKRQMHTNQHEICSGRFVHTPPISDELRLKYREKWATTPPRAREPVERKPAEQLNHQPAPIPQEGPGTELKELLTSLGLTEAASGCMGGCGGFAAQMNLWGVQGCRENRDAIIRRLNDESKKVGWLDKLKAAKEAGKQFLFFNPFDPAPGLLDEAIRRAESKTK